MGGSINRGFGWVDFAVVLPQKCEFSGWVGGVGCPACRIGRGSASRGCIRIRRHQSGAGLGIRGLIYSFNFLRKNENSYRRLQRRVGDQGNYPRMIARRNQGGGRDRTILMINKDFHQVFLPRCHRQRSQDQRRWSGRCGNQTSCQKRRASWSFGRYRFRGARGS